MKKLKTRKNIRLKTYDYSQNGMYFITICTKNRMKLFGEIKRGGLDRPAIPQIIGLYKSGVTRIYNKKNKINIQLWQRGYYEHIIRNKKEYQKICEYIKNNPKR